MSNANAGSRGQEKIRKWTKGVSIFNLDFIIVPIIEKNHWSLAIICFPWPEHVGIAAVDSAMNPPGFKNNGDTEKPCILIFDSLATDQTHIINMLRDYLNCEYEAKNAGEPKHPFTEQNMPGYHVAVPQQTNSFDCSIYLLCYAEKFFKDAIDPPYDLSNWFDTIVATRKREEISNLIKVLMRRYSISVTLPSITLPTINGKLKNDIDSTYPSEKSKQTAGPKTNASKKEMETVVPKSDASKKSKGLSVKTSKR